MWSIYTDKYIRIYNCPISMIENIFQFSLFPKTVKWFLLVQQGSIWVPNMKMTNIVPNNLGRMMYFFSFFLLMWLQDVKVPATASRIVAKIMDRGSVCCSVQCAMCSDQLLAFNVQCLAWRLQLLRSVCTVECGMHSLHTVHPSVPSYLVPVLAEHHWQSALAQ